MHSGYGSNVTTPADPKGWREQQTGLLNYLCVGIGPLFSERIVRRALRLQAIKTSVGMSGIHPETFNALIQLSNSDTLPEVPMFGSLGASGVLVMQKTQLKDGPIRFNLEKDVERLKMKQNKKSATNKTKLNVN